MLNFTFLATVGQGPWTHFSAVCWLYGKLLFEELGYPIGLIDTNWGGTPVEAWSSPDALAKCGLRFDSHSVRYRKISWTYSLSQSRQNYLCLLNRALLIHICCSLLNVRGEGQGCVP